jgi:hypothetical protein
LTRDNDPRCFASRHNTNAPNFPAFNACCQERTGEGLPFGNLAVQAQRICDEIVAHGRSRPILARSLSMHALSLPKLPPLDHKKLVLSLDPIKPARARLPIPVDTTRGAPALGRGMRLRNGQLDPPLECKDASMSKPRCGEAHQLRIYRGPEKSSIATRPVQASASPQITVSVGEVLPLLAHAVASQRTWLKDFADDEISISADLYEVLLAYQYYHRPSA